MDDFSVQRKQMVERQIAARGVCDSLVLAAMKNVPRECFVLERWRDHAYEDRPLPVALGQTISQPFIVALMIEALGLQGGEKVLDVGTGSGYAAAVLSKIAAEVYSVERLSDLVAYARERFQSQRYDNIHQLQGDGSLGWPEHAPYDAIVVAAAGPDVPEPLREQLTLGGRLVMPLGSAGRIQMLVRETRRGEDRFKRDALGEVGFVPLIGAEAWHENNN